MNVTVCSVYCDLNYNYFVLRLKFELVWNEWNRMVSTKCYSLRKKKQDRSKQDGINIVYEDNLLGNYLLGNVLCPSLEVPKNQRPR